MVKHRLFFCAGYVFWNKLRLVKTQNSKEISATRQFICEALIFFETWVLSNLNLFWMVYLWNFCNEYWKLVIRKYSVGEILWWLFIFNLKCLCHKTNWKVLLDKCSLKIKGLLKFGNLSWQWYLMYLPYQLSYHPEKILKIDLVCPIVIKRIKTKIEANFKWLVSIWCLN